MNLKYINQEIIWLYVDHTSRFNRNTGIQRCVRSLAVAFQYLGVQLQPVIWDRKNKSFQPATVAQRLHLAKWNGPDPSKWADSGKTKVSELLPAKWAIIPELVSGPFNPDTNDLLRASKHNSVKLAWLFHDAIPYRFPRFYPNLQVNASNSHIQYMNGLAKFDLVLANSYTTKQHLSEYWQTNNIIPRAILKAVPLGEDFIGYERLPSKSYGNLVLSIGSLEPRKNHLSLLKAFTALVAEGTWPLNLDLVIVGWPNDITVVNYVEKTLQLGLPLRWEKNADDILLNKFYSQTLFTIFPSIEEGFGLPIAESIWHNRICICNNKGAIYEIARKGGCLTLNTNDWRDLKNGIKLLITKPSLRNKLNQEIRNRFFRSWKDVAREWLDLMQMH